MTGLQSAAEQGILKFSVRGGTVHRDKYGCYHPNPDEDCHWTIIDSRGYIDPGSPCDKCNDCECGLCPDCDRPWCDPIDSFDECRNIVGCSQEEVHATEDGGSECIGLSFFFLCLDGGEALCSECAESAGIEIMECTCR